MEGAALSAIFTRDGDAYVPTGHARGPWDPDAQHGGAPAALLAREVAALAPAMHVTRLTYELLGPVPLAPLLVTARITKPGRRFQLAEGEITTPDHRALVRVRAVLLRRAEVDLPPDGVADGGLPCEGPGASVASGTFGSGEGFHLTGMDLRFAAGTSFLDRGRAFAWFRWGVPLVAGEPDPPAVALAAAAADFGNGVSHAVPFDRFLFVNTDLTVHLHRPPDGAWVLLDARTQLQRGGAGLAWSVLHDERGPIGLSAQSLYVDHR